MSSDREEWARLRTTGVPQEYPASSPALIVQVAHRDPVFDDLKGPTSGRDTSSLPERFHRTFLTVFVLFFVLLLLFLGSFP